MERLFQIGAVILAGIAAYFLWQGNADRAFASAVFGAVAFFLSIRFQVKGRLKVRDAKRLEAEEEEEFDAPPLLNEIPASDHINNRPRTTNDEQKI